MKATMHSNAIQLPLPNEVETVEIPLTQGQVTVVDAMDGDLLELSWHADYNQCTRSYYAKHTTRRVNGKQFGKKMHRVILQRMLGRSLTRSERVDHIDRNSLNNRRNNLRLATPSQNNSNSGLRSNNTSGFKGVTWNRDHQRWMAYVNCDGKRRHLGYFYTALEAALAYDLAACELHGEFAVLNFTLPLLDRS